MRRPEWELLWVFLVAPWLAWAAFHPLADGRLVWTLVAYPREAGAAVMEALQNAYDVPPIAQMVEAVHQPIVVRSRTAFPKYPNPRACRSHAWWVKVWRAAVIDCRSGH